MADQTIHLIAHLQAIQCMALLLMRGKGTSVCSVAACVQSEAEARQLGQTADSSTADAPPEHLPGAAGSAADSPQGHAVGESVYGHIVAANRALQEVVACAHAAARDPTLRSQVPDILDMLGGVEATLKTLSMNSN